MVDHMDFPKSRMAIRTYRKKKPPPMRGIGGVDVPPPASEEHRLIRAGVSGEVNFSTVQRRGKHPDPVTRTLPEHHFRESGRQVRRFVENNPALPLQRALDRDWGSCTNTAKKATPVLGSTLGRRDSVCPRSRRVECVSA